MAENKLIGSGSAVFTNNRGKWRCAIWRHTRAGKGRPFERNRGGINVPREYPASHIHVTEQKGHTAEEGVGLGIFSLVLYVINVHCIDDSQLDFFFCIVKNQAPQFETENHVTSSSNFRVSITALQETNASAKQLRFAEVRLQRT